MDLFGKKKNVIGVDIGSSAIKIVELKDTKKGYQLVNYGIAPIPSEVIVDGAIMDSFASGLATHMRPTVPAREMRRSPGSTA